MIGRAKWRKWYRALPFPLLGVLGLQSALSIHLIWANTAFQDEALYLWAGRLELSNWATGAPIPAFPTYLSGAPPLYPPIGALASSLGGLPAARLLALAFMLAATTFLWHTASELFGTRTAFVASALYAMLGPTIKLGAFATFDAPALSLLAASAWLAVRAGRPNQSAGSLVALAAVLTLADATAYSTILFDPVILALLTVVSLQHSDGRPGLQRSATALLYLVGFSGLLLLVGGGEYWTGLDQTVLARTSGTAPATAVFAQTWHLTAIILITSAGGVVVAVLAFSQRKLLPLLTVLFLATLLVPAEQAHVHTLTSLDKHLALGAWFGAIAGGHFLGQLVRPRSAGVISSIGAITLATVLAGTLVVGYFESTALFHQWPGSAAAVHRAAVVLRSAKGPILAENPSLFEYYLPQGSEWQRWSSSCSIRLPVGESISRPVGSCVSTATYLGRVRRGFFSVIILLFGSTGPFDGPVVRALAENHHYHLVESAPYGRVSALVWEYQPQSHFDEAVYNSRTAPSTPLGGLLSPIAHPRPLLGTLTEAVSITALLTALLTLAIKFGWRRHKGPADP